MRSPFGHWCALLFALVLGLLSGCTAASDDDDSVAPPALWTADCPPETVERRSVDTGEVTLHVACIGSGPTLVMLHGFPEYWYGGWEVARRLAADFRVLMPDQRGYNLSDKPTGLEAYKMQPLIADIVGLLEAVSDEPVLLMAHDWGGAIGWGIAAQHGELLSGLVIANAPHPDVFARELADNPDQQSASSYVHMLTDSGAEETLAGNDFALLSYMMGGVLSDADLLLYKEAWGQPGALTAMVNWYRANFDGLTLQLGDEPALVDVPTQVLWGMQDSALLPGNLTGLQDYVSSLQIQEFPDATHWILHEEPEAVAAAVRSFAAGL